MEVSAAANAFRQSVSWPGEKPECKHLGHCSQGAYMQVAALGSAFKEVGSAWGCNSF
ncbi:uncharacterized protein SONE68_1541 [Lacticaseibacillus paracasei]|nr:uncharacterized protein SONE68_1541 [Lacticaseibacillus paracasei]GEK38561.1 hypothetical protein LCA02_02510 [Lacticaseibacillus casei]